MALSRTRVSPEHCSARPPVPSPRPPAGDGPLAADGEALAGGGEALARDREGLARDGEALCGGTANRGRVVRVGDTVRRPIAPYWRATHALLGHLAAVGFDGAPRVLAAGTRMETLSYVEGLVPVPSVPAEILADAALASVADLLRRYHRAVASFDPAGYVWPRPAVPARYRGGLISHNDVYPANLVFREGRAVALIDFDLAGPGCAAWDFAAAARSLVPLADEADVLDCRQGRAMERFGVFLDSTGLSRAGRVAVAAALLPNHDWTYAIVTEAAAAGHAGFADHWRAVAGMAGRAREWCERHQGALLAVAAEG